MLKQRIHLQRCWKLLLRICNQADMHEPMYASRIGRFFKCADSHIRSIMKKLVEAGLILRFKKGRIKKIVLTEKGKIACRGVREIRAALKAFIVYLFK